MSYMSEKAIDAHNAVSEIPNTDQSPSPEACNFCNKPAAYYGKTKNGLRGYMCQDCYRVHGKGQAKKV